MLNTPGTIDSDYRGEVQVLLINLGDKPFAIARGERIAQLVVQRVERAGLSETVDDHQYAPRRGRLRVDRKCRQGVNAETQTRRTQSKDALTHAQAAHPPPKITAR